MMSDKPVEIAIIGGGIGGLCLAAGLLKIPSISVHVYEGTKAFLDVGAGLALHGNALRAMEMIGPEVRQAYFNRALLLGEDENKELGTEVLVGSGEQAYEVVVFLGKAKGRKTLSRAELMDELVKLIPAERMHFGRRTSAIIESGQDITLQFKDGTEAKADFVIGADGIHSIIRKYLLEKDFPDLVEPVDHGWISYHRKVPMKLAKDAVAAQGKDPDAALDAVKIWIGDGAYVNTIPTNKGEICNVTVVYNIDQLPKGSTLDNHKCADLYKHFVPEVRALAELVDEDRGDTWPLRDHDSAPYYYTGGRVAMMGDAAHATLPFSGNGAAQAIEDALVLFTLFEKVKHADEISSVLHAFETSRKTRSQRVVTSTRLFGKCYCFDPDTGGSELSKIREVMKEGAYFNNFDLQKQNEHALTVFKDLEFQRTQKSNAS